MTTKTKAANVKNSGKALNPGAAKAKAAAEARRAEKEKAGTTNVAAAPAVKPNEVKGIPTVDTANTGAMAEAGNILDTLLAEDPNAAAVPAAVPTPDAGVQTAAFNPESFVVVDGDNVTVNYPEADYSVLKMPTVDEIRQAAEAVSLTDTNVYENPLAAVKAGNLSRFVVWLQKTFNGNQAELESFVKNVIVSASMLPVLAVRETIDAAARNIVENQAAEKRRVQQEEEDRIALEAVQEMQQTMIDSFVAKGLDPETAKRKAEELLAPKQTRSTGSTTGSQFNYNRVLIKCGEHEFEMGERGFHPRIAQELWEKEGITKEEFVKKYTARIVRQGTV